MSRIYKHILIIVVIIFVFVQISCINIMNEAQNNKVSNVQNATYKYNHKTLRQLNEELNYLKEKTILSANEIDGKWYVKIKIQGTREELLNEISKLKDYDINDFIINKNKDENSIILEISTNERA